MATVSPLIRSAWPSRMVRCGIRYAQYLAATRPIVAVSGWPGDW